MPDHPHNDWDCDRGYMPLDPDAYKKEYERQQKIASEDDLKLFDPDTYKIWKIKRDDEV